MEGLHEFAPLACGPLFAPSWDRPPKATLTVATSRRQRFRDLAPRRFARSAGLSLVEVTIMLLVLMLLTSVLAPAIWDFVHDAQWVKVKEDCEAIGVSISRLVRDVGCVKIDGTLGCGAGIINSPGWLASAPYPNMFASDANDPHSLDAQLVTNLATQSYPSIPFDSSAIRLAFGMGWRGAYLSPPIGPDPWGGPYIVGDTDHFLRAGLADYSDDVLCVTGGPDGQISSTWTSGGGVLRRGDDFVFVISGSPR